MSSFRDQLFLVKAETTPGVFETLAGADVVPCQSTTPTISATPVERSILSPAVPGKLTPDVMAEEQTAVTITTEVSGSGQAGTPSPVLGKMLALAGFNQTIATGQTVTNALPWPHPTARYSFAFDHSGQRFAGRGGLAETITFSGEAGQIMNVETAIRGIYVPISAVSAVTPTFPTLQTPAIINSSGVGTVTIAGVSSCIAAYSCTVQNTVTRRDDGGDCPPSMVVTDRRVSGSITIRRPENLATLNLYEKALASETMAIVFPYGKTAGNIITFNHPKVAGMIPASNDRNGLIYLTIEWTQINPLLTDQFTIVQS
ncbi:MAG: phage tail tube protein [Cyanobacteriota bacterium]